MATRENERATASIPDTFWEQQIDRQRVLRGQSCSLAQAARRWRGRGRLSRARELGRLRPARPRRARSFTMAETDLANDFDIEGPQSASFFSHHDFKYAVYDSLTDFDVSSDLGTAVKQGKFSYKVVPRLATSWEASKDRRTYRFHLRKGVKSNWGNELDAEDVVRSLARTLAFTSSPASSTSRVRRM